MTDFTIAHNVSSKGEVDAVMGQATDAGAVLDTAIFFSLAFAGTDVPWVTLAVGDFGVKLAIALFALLPFRLALRLVRPAN